MHCVPVATTNGTPTPTELNRAVARELGETVGEVNHRGFTLECPANRLVNEEDEPAERWLLALARKAK